MRRTALSSVFAATERGIDDPRRKRLAITLTQEEGVVAEAVPVRWPRAKERLELIEVLKLRPSVCETLRQGLLQVKHHE